MAIKRYLVAAAAAGVVFTGVYGAAAALDITNDPALQVGQVDLECDSDGVEVEPAGFEFDNGTFQGIRVTGIATECFGNDLGVQVLDGIGGVMMQEFVTINAATMTVQPDPDVDLDATDATTVNLVIES